MAHPIIAIPTLSPNVSNYTAALESLGARVAILSPQEEIPELYDGLLLPGGGDLHPSLYGEEMRGSKNPSLELDRFQLAALEAFVSRKKPVLGICRGHQLINVYFGGTLIQNLPTFQDHARDAPISQNPDKIHAVEASSWVRELYGESFLVNSSHHQGVGRVAGPLSVDAISPGDQVVEALHHETLPIWSVQWHPERLCLSYAREDASDGGEIFSFFLRQIP